MGCMSLYDLTHSLAPGMPVYPGDPEVAFHPHSDLERDGFRVAEVRLGTHAGTHLDAPAHFLPHGATVDQLPAEALVGPARVVGMDGPFHVAPGERILLRSGWSARWGEADYHEAFPAIPAALAEALAAAPAALIGLETPSLHPDHAEDDRLHRLLLGAGVVIVENLTGLDPLPEHVSLAALPFPLTGLDGSPCRVIAWDEAI